MFVNHYEILGVDEDADLAQISAARKKLLTKYHPDRNPGDDSAKDQTVLINSAFDILSDPKKRARFDKKLKQFRASREDVESTTDPGPEFNEFDSATGDSYSPNQSEQYTDRQPDPFQVNPSQNSNRRNRGSFGNLIGIVLGGLAAIPVGLYFAWLISGTDPLDIFGKPNERTADNAVSGKREKENTGVPSFFQTDAEKKAGRSFADNVDSEPNQSNSVDSGTSHNADDQQPKSNPDEDRGGDTDTNPVGNGSALSENKDDHQPNVNHKPLTEATTSSENAVPGRLPIPDMDQVALAKQKIADMYRAEYELANSAPRLEKFPTLRDLSKRIMEMQTQVSDPVESYAIFEVAIDISRQSGFPVEALEIVAQFEDKFDVDGMTIRMQHFDYWCDEVRREVPVREARETAYLKLANSARPFVEQFVETKNWELAFDFVSLVRKLYVNGGDRDSGDKVIDAFPKLEWKRNEQIKVNDYLTELAENPGQPDKQLTVGCYFCFVMDQWDQGLQHLNQSSRPDLADCVSQDLESTATTNEPASSELVGDRWWELANDDALKPYQDAIYARAEQHYLKALVDATGITRAKLIERIRIVSPLPNITIVSAKFGWNRKWVDATESLREILEREPPVFLNSARGLKVADPIPKIKKVTRITYTIDGQTKNIRLKAGPNRRYNLREQLK